MRHRSEQQTRAQRRVLRDRDTVAYSVCVCVCSYFRALVEQFEVQLQQYRQQIEELENHLTTQSSGSHITPQGSPGLKS